MISFVRGTVASAGVDSLVVDIGPVGLSVTCTPATALSVTGGQHVELVTTMVVREDAWTLYGFGDADERAVFEIVQTVTGIGPRIALALLASMTPDELRRAIAAEDLTALTKVPGIGRKGAARLVLELKDKIGVAASGGADAESMPLAGAGWQVAVAAGLVSLGWSAKEAEVAVQAVTPLAANLVTAQGDPDVGGLLKAALRSLDRS